MKRNICFITLFFTLCISIFPESIKAYFPANGCPIEYENSFFNNTEIVALESINFEQREVIVKAVKNLSGVKYSLHTTTDDSIILECDVLEDGTKTKNYGYSILKEPGNNWTYQDPVDDERYEFESDIASIDLGFAQFDNCIRIKKNIFLQNTLFGTEYSYFYKGIGLVEWELRNPDGEVKQKKTIKNKGDSYTITPGYIIMQNKTE
jgi:hypothetical protein